MNPPSLPNRQLRRQSAPAPRAPHATPNALSCPHNTGIRAPYHHLPLPPHHLPTWTTPYLSTQLLPSTKSTPPPEDHPWISMPGIFDRQFYVEMLLKGGASALRDETCLQSDHNRLSRHMKISKRCTGEIAICGASMMAVNVLLRLCTQSQQGSRTISSR